jgi:Tol biopolymer transport system component
VPFQLAQYPRWSPTGEWISFVSDKGNDSGAPDIWLWSARTGRQIRLTHLEARIGWTSWSPDGKWIAFSGGLAGNYDIWKAAVPSGETTRLTTDPRYEVVPTWTPDSQRIVYVAADERWVDHDVMEMSADGRDARLIVGDTDFFDYQTSGTPAFGAPLVSPDGRTLLFRSWRSGWINLWTVPMTGARPTPLAPESWDQSEGRWSPDGRQIAFISNHNGTCQLRVATMAGGDPRTLVGPTMGVVSGIEWAPDGQRISYALETPTRG